LANRSPGGAGGTRDAPRVDGLLEKKLELLRAVLETTRQELLLVDLDGLGPLLERKERLIAEVDAVDAALAGLDAAAVEQGRRQTRDELERIVVAVLDNEGTLAARLDAERERLRQDLRELERETRLRGYLESQQPGGRKVDVKQ
jgi:uncharacterized membrane protein YccC